MDRIAVLIPCYNEERTVEKVVTDFRRVLPEAVIYVYNNNSTLYREEDKERLLAYMKKLNEVVKGSVRDIGNNKNPIHQ